MVLIFRPHITFYPPDMTSTASVATTRRLARNNSAVVRSTAAQHHGVQLLGRAVWCHCTAVVTAAVAAVETSPAAGHWTASVIRVW